MEALITDQYQITKIEFKAERKPQAKTSDL